MVDKPTHDELAKRWLDANPHTRIVGKQWWRYADNFWQMIETSTVENEILQTLIAARREGIKPSKSVCESVVYVCEKQSALGPNVLESNMDILPCQNGVLQLSTRVLLPHYAEHYVTSLLPYAYDPAAVATRWRYFLDTTLEPDVIVFLQEFAGYCLTIETRHETAIWLCGPMGSGKTTALMGLIAMLGRRAALLGLAEMESSRFALYDIPGKTLLYATEQPGGSTRLTNLINRVISGEAIYIEKKYEHAKQIIPRAKIAWAMNDLPTITSATDGLFRRVKVIEFHERTTEIIPEIKEEIAREGAGILNWALVGLDRLTKRKRFDVPLRILNATKAYQNMADYPRLFVAERCDGGDELNEGAMVLYSAYSDYCKAIGVKHNNVKTMTELADDWRRLGFTKYMSDGRVRWKGVKVKPW